MKLAFAFSLFVCSLVVADEPLSFDPLKASAEDCDRLANSHAWKWQCRTAEPQKLLLLSYYHFTRDAAGNWQKRQLVSSSDYSGNEKLDEVLVLLSIDRENIQFSNTFSRPNSGSVGASGEFKIPSKGFLFVGRGDGGLPTRIGKHFVLLAKTKDGKEPKQLNDLSEFVSVDLTIAE